MSLLNVLAKAVGNISTVVQLCAPPVVTAVSLDGRSRWETVGLLFTGGETYHGEVLYPNLF